MIEEKYYYKVVWEEDDGILHSCCGGGGNYYNYVIYLINKWVKPYKDCGPLAVFETVRNAWCFINFEFFDCNKHRKIYLCNIVKSKENIMWYTTTDGIRESSYIPMGTVLADKVKLIKEIK